MDRSECGLIKVGYTETSVLKEVRHFYERQDEVSIIEFLQHVKLQFPFVRLEHIGIRYAKKFYDNRRGSKFRKFKDKMGAEIGELKSSRHYIAFTKREFRRCFWVYYFKIEVWEEPEEQQGPYTVKQ